MVNKPDYYELTSWGHFALEVLEGLGKVCPIYSLSSSALPSSVLRLKRLAVQSWNVELFLGGDREVRGAELPMLSKTFSYSSNNRAFMEMANLGF